MVAPTRRGRTYYFFTIHFSLTFVFGTSNSFYHYVVPLPQRWRLKIRTLHITGGKNHSLQDELPVGVNWLRHELAMP